MYLGYLYITTLSFCAILINPAAKVCMPRRTSPGQAARMAGYMLTLYTHEKRAAGPVNERGSPPAFLFRYDYFMITFLQAATFLSCLPAVPFP